MVEALLLSEEPSEQTTVPTKGKQAKRTTAKPLVVDKGNKANMPPLIRNCILDLQAVTVNDKERMQIGRRKRRDSKEAMV